MTQGHRDLVGIEIERAHRAGPAAVPSLSLRALPQAPNWPRFSKPPYDPGRSDFPSPVLASALTVFVRASLPPRRETAVLAHPSPRHRGVCTAPSPRRRPRRTQLRVWLRAHRHGHRVPRAPLPSTGVTRAGAASQAAWRGVTPSSVAHTGSCARPSPSQRLRFVLGRWVFAGCHQSLLGDGPSRHYLCDPCAGARTPTPPRSPVARIRFFTEDAGLTPI